MPTFSEPVDFSKQEARNLVTHKLASAPTSPTSGQRYYDTTLNKEGVYNGTSWDYAGSGGVTAVAGSTPITSTGGSTPTIAISPASGSTAGSISISDFNKLAAATAVNTVSTIVLRDSSGNVAFGTATGALTGTASNASNLNSQTPAFYLGRANHTGSQTSGTISDFDTQVRSSRLNQLAAPTSTVSLNSQKIANLAPPQNGTDAVNKAYADSLLPSSSGLGLLVHAQQNQASPIAAADTFVPFSTEVADTQNIFSNGYFTPIVFGVYRISCNLYFSVDNNGWVGDHRATVFQGNTLIATLFQNDVYVTNFITSGHADIPLTAGVAYHIRASSSPYSNGINPKIATKEGTLNTLTIERIS